MLQAVKQWMEWIDQWFPKGVHQRMVFLGSGIILGKAADDAPSARCALDASLSTLSLDRRLGGWNASKRRQRQGTLVPRLCHPDDRGAVIAGCQGI